MGSLAQVDPPTHSLSHCPQIGKSTSHDPPIRDYTHSPSYPSPNPSLFAESSLDNSNNSSPSPDPYDSPVDQPPSSAFPSEPSSALASDSEVPFSSSSKATKQTGLLDFFSKMPSGEFHARWRKRKRDNAERDREEYERQKMRDDEEKLHKKARRREQYRAAQNKQRNRLKAEKQVAGKQDSSVSFLYLVMLVINS